VIRAPGTHAGASAVLLEVQRVRCRVSEGQSVGVGKSVKNDLESAGFETGSRT
jgi:hypothetical protein